MARPGPTRRRVHGRLQPAAVRRRLPRYQPRRGEYQRGHRQPAVRGPEPLPEGGRALALDLAPGPDHATSDPEGAGVPGRAGPVAGRASAAGRGPLGRRDVVGSSRATTFSPDGQARIRQHRFPAEGGASEEARPTPVPLSRPESAAGCLACEGPRGRIPGSPHRRRPWRADLRRVLSQLPERPRPARRSDSGSARGAGYDVFGWYSDGEKNPLAQYFLDFQRAGWKPSKPEATIQDDFARAVAENLGWSVDRAPGPSFPGRLLCLGRLAFDIPGPVAEAPSFSAPDPKIVLASTGTEACRSTWPGQ